MDAKLVLREAEILKKARAFIEEDWKKCMANLEETTKDLPCRFIAEPEASDLKLILEHRDKGSGEKHKTVAAWLMHDKLMVAKANGEVAKLKSSDWQTASEILKGLLREYLSWVI